MVGVAVSSVMVVIHVASATSVVWYRDIAMEGASCDAMCANRGGCSETCWPQSAAEFREIDDMLPEPKCSNIVSGGAIYDPSMALDFEASIRDCGWAPDPKPSCSAAPLHVGTVRFCPCGKGLPCAATSSSSALPIIITVLTLVCIGLCIFFVLKSRRRVNETYNELLPTDPLALAEKDLKALDCPAQRGWFVLPGTDGEVCKCGGGSHRLSLDQIKAMVEKQGLNPELFAAFLDAERATFVGRNMQELIEKYLQSDSADVRRIQESYENECQRVRAGDESLLLGCGC